MAGRSIRRAALTALLVVCLVTPVFAHADALGEVAPGGTSVVVSYSPGEASSAVGAVIDAGGTIDALRAGERILLVDAPPSLSGQEFAEQLTDTPGVRFAEVVQPVRALVNDPAFGDQWNIVRVGAPAAWGVTTGRADVVVAVVDTGVDSSHPDLAGRVDVARGRNFVPRESGFSDRHGHGTHVAGIIAANTGNGIDIAGIAPGITLLPVRVLDNTGSGDTDTLSRGITYAADMGVRVVNLSLGFPAPSQQVEDAVKYAEARGCLVVAAAGNSGKAELEFPAGYPSVLAVGATDATDSRAAFSQYGAELDLMAPGVTSLRPAVEGLVSLAPVTGPAAIQGVTTTRDAGTSMAAPHVSAAAALVSSLHPGWSAATVANRLTATARDLGQPGKDATTGHGMLRIDAALGVGGTASTDDSSPGVPIPPSPHVNVVDVLADPLDVFEIDLEVGEDLTLALTGAEGAVTEVALHAPGDLPATLPLLSARSTGQAVSGSFGYRAVTSGVHRIVVRAIEGGGDYRLLWTRGFPTNLRSAAPATCAWGGSAIISGTLTRSATGAGAAGAGVVVDERRWGASEWKTAVASGVTDANGAYRIRVKPKMRTRYRVRFAGTSRLFAANGRTHTVTPRAYLSAPSPQSRVRRGSVFNVRGTLKPEHVAGARSVKVTVHRRAGGRWVFHRAVYARNLDRQGYTRYSAWMSLRSAGRYRLTASVTGDSRHVATRSKATYVTVR